MRCLLAVVIGLLPVDCAPLTEEKDESRGNDVPGASCPNHKEATWCLLFSDLSSAGVIITQTEPKALGVLSIAKLNIPLEGEINSEENSFSLRLNRSAQWLSSSGVFEGIFSASLTHATAHLKFNFVSENFSAYDSKSFPQNATYGSQPSVTGTWSDYPQASTLESRFELVQAGNLLLMVTNPVSKNENVLFLWPGKRNALTFSFPKVALIEDGGSWIGGEFSSDLTMATGTRCDDSIVGAQCMSLIWYRR